MIRLFSSNRASVLILIPLIIALYFALNYWQAYYVDEITINLGIWGEYEQFNPLVARISSGILIFIIALLINLIFNTNEFFDRNNYLPSMLYVVMMSFYHSFYSIDGIQISHLFIVLMFMQLFKLNQHLPGKRQIFNAMFFAGIATSFHPPLIAFFLFFYFMILVIRPFQFKELIIGLLGFSIPIIYAFVLLIVFQQAIDLEILNQSTDYTNKQTDFLITTVLFSLMLILSLIGYRAKIKSSGIRLKKLNSIIAFWLFIAVSLGFYDFIKFQQIERFSFMLIAFAFYLTYAFTSKLLTTVASILFYITFIYSLIKFFI